MLYAGPTGAESSMESEGVNRWTRRRRGIAWEWEWERHLPCFLPYMHAGRARGPGVNFLLVGFAPVYG